MRVSVLGLIAALACCTTGAARAEEPSNFKILKLEGNNVRWQKAADLRLPPVVTYALAAGPAEFPGARNCRKLTSLDGLTQTSGVAAAAVRDEIAAAFAMWQAAAGITFREASDPSTADIVIGAQVEPEGWAFADVFYDAKSTEHFKPISRSLVCLNPSKRWKIGFDGDLQTYDLRYTIAHEIGHAIGLDHPSGAGAIMGYRYEERFRQLQPGDVQGAMALYGAARAPATVAAEARPAEEPQDASRPDARSTSNGLGTRALNARSSH